MSENLSGSSWIFDRQFFFLPPDAAASLILLYAARLVLCWTLNPAGLSRLLVGFPVSL
ncbi:hypothetical protein LDENG_00294380 [Lucifuga dentata]|nr:hypothetical protein LDENG_00294380 [Lucifuga dentata]